MDLLLSETICNLNMIFKDLNIIYLNENLSYKEILKILLSLNPNKKNIIIIYCSILNISYFSYIQKYSSVYRIINIVKIKENFVFGINIQSLSNDIFFNNNLINSYDKSSLKLIIENILILLINTNVTNILYFIYLLKETLNIYNYQL